MARLLIVDDDRDILTILRNGFRMRGHEVVDFSDPSEARRWLRTGAPDGVLLDVRMPAVSGWDLLGDIRGNRRSERLPVVMLSANGDVAERVRGLRLGADDFCVKPFDLEEVVARVEGLLARRNLGRSALQGELATFAMTEVLQSIEQQRLSGELEVVDGARLGLVEFVRGAMVAAALTPLAGREALLELLATKRGAFRFLGDPEEGEGDEPSPPPLAPIQELLLERAWIEDELSIRRGHEPADGDRLEAVDVPLARLALDRLPRLPVAEAAEALRSAGAGANGNLTWAELRARLGCCSARASLTIVVLLEAGAVRRATGTAGTAAAPAAPAAAGEPARDELADADGAMPARFAEILESIDPRDLPPVRFWAKLGTLECRPIGDPPPHAGDAAPPAETVLACVLTARTLAGGADSGAVEFVSNGVGCWIGWQKDRALVLADSLDEGSRVHRFRARTALASRLLSIAAPKAAGSAR